MKPQHLDDTRSETALDPGLCANCVHVDGCILRQGVTETILFCEEHQAGGTAPTRSRPPVLQAPPTGELAGLCVNCADRDTCTFPKAEGGVWQCEDYR